MGGTQPLVGNKAVVWKSASEQIRKHWTRVNQRMDQSRAPMKIFICYSFDENNEKDFANISYKECYFHCLIL